MGREELIATAFRYLSNFSDSVVSISTAVELIQVLEALVALSSSNKTLKSKLVEICDKLIKKEWFTYGGNQEKGSAYTQNISLLLKAYLQHDADIVTSIHSMCINGIEKLSESVGKDPSSAMYPTLSKSTVLVYYRCLLENLGTGTRKVIAESSSGKSGRFKQLETWHLAIKTFYVLISFLKQNDSNLLLLSVCLKHSKGFLDLFLQQGMPLMDKCLQTEREEVIGLIKNLQLSTRFLQNLCTHVKRKQDMRLMSYVPQVKRSLETLIFRVKAMLAVNQCQGAFWLGNLKNRDLQGEELPSQDCDEEKEDGDDDSTVGEVEQAEEDDESDIDLDEEEAAAAATEKTSDDNDSYKSTVY